MTLCLRGAHTNLGAYNSGPAKHTSNLSARGAFCPLTVPVVLEADDVLGIWANATTNPTSPHYK